MATLQEANRRLNKAYNKIRENNFDLSGLLGLDLHNKVAGIMGTGKIGVCMANICKGYGMTVLGWDAYPNKELEESGLLTYVTKEELLQRSDLISLHAPLIMGEGGTYHLINKETIALMKDNAMLVNTARGGLIDAEKLILTEDCIKELIKNYNLAIFTGRDRASATYTLEKWNLNKYFYPIITFENVGWNHQKPDTKGVSIIKEKVIADEIYYLGDTVDDMICARNSKVNGIGVLPPRDKSEKLKSRLLEEGAITVLEITTDLPKLLSERKNLITNM